ncbi:Ig-like domain-containing protein [Gammaproteobacteria bacterium]|nr:Ig-like domain-containing protein [Gammaproteobacteria bacterium]
MKSFKAFLSFALISLLFIAKISFALPFSITPSGVFPSTVVNGGQTEAIYNVKNITSVASPATFVKFLPPNVKQIIDNTDPTLCGTLFNLAPGASCQLKLVIAGAVDPLDTNPEHHLFVCRQDGKTCAGPRQELDVSVINLLSITVTPANIVIPYGGTQQYTAMGTYSDGTTRCPLTTVTWTSSSADLTIDSSSGLATAVNEHPANDIIITATQSTPLPGVSGTTLASIGTAQLVSISVSPLFSTKIVGTTQDYIATATYQNATTADVSTSVIWFSDTPAVATIPPTTVLSPNSATAVSAGTTNIQAVLGSIFSNTAELLVTNASVVSFTISPTNPTILVNGTQNFTAEATLDNGTMQDVTNDVAWISGTPSVASIVSGSPNGGLATGLSYGTSVINAKYGSIFADSTQTLTVDLINPQSIFAGLTSGYIKASPDSGEPGSWTNAIAGGIQINGIAADGTNAYAGNNGGDIYISTNSGVSWATSFSAPNAVNAVLVSKPSNTSIFAATDGGEVYLSTDQGANFAQVTALPAPITEPLISLAYSNPNLYVGRSNGDVCTTTNDGSTWVACVTTPNANPINAMAAFTNYVYAGTEAGEICISIDFGATFPSCVQVTSPNAPVRALATDPFGHIFAGMANGQVCVSHDNANTFSCVTVSGVNTQVFSLTVDGNNDIFAGLEQNIGICKSTDLGINWACNEPTAGADVRALAALNP